MIKEVLEDMTEYTGESFLKYEDVAAAPRRGKIVGVRMGDFGRPVLKLESGDSLTLNKTNTRTLIRAFGKDGRRWIDQFIELRAGQTSYQGQNKQSVLVRPVSKPIESSARGAPDADNSESNDDAAF